ncbi:recombinase family protein [Paenibacillaceae bacterium WGS1546]|uniref:recombinase family protein n=1 Tax=Cohnella sp. WGS1546 TaxID=3366810 RepID=UPI00372D5A0E
MTHSQGKKFGYARVSKTIQNEDRQVDLLTGNYGIPMEDVFIDKMTGARKDRPAFEKLQLILRPGDTVYVSELSRLSRKTSDLIALLTDWQEKNIGLISHRENIDLGSPTGRLIVHLLIGLAEFERENLRERVRDGVASARARGRIGGRPRTDKKMLEKAIRMYEAESRSVSVSEIVAVCKVSKSVLYRELQARRANNNPPPADNER